MFPRHSIVRRRRHAACAAFVGVLVAGCGPVRVLPTAMATREVPASSPTAFPPSPTLSASPTPACLAAGTWIDFHYRGVAVAQDVPARVYLPPCYAEQEGAAYPTAYFLHGKPYSEAQWADLGLPELVEKAVAGGEFPPMILVLARQPEPLFSGSDGGPGSYETEFIDGLMAAVDDRFRTQARPEGRAVVGLSRGGVWALEIGLRHPAEIGFVVALSPALAVNYARAVYDPLELAVDGGPLPTQFLLAAGDDDWARAKTELFAEAIAARAAAADTVIVPGAHADSTWQALLPSVIAFLAGAFGEVPAAGG